MRRCSYFLKYFSKRHPVHYHNFYVHICQYNTTFGLDGIRNCPENLIFSLIFQPPLWLEIQALQQTLFYFFKLQFSGGYQHENLKDLSKFARKYYNVNIFSHQKCIHCLLSSLKYVPKFEKNHIVCDHLHIHTYTMIQNLNFIT